jgi:hypothetical protein
MDAVNAREPAQVISTQHFPFVQLWPGGRVSSGSDAEEFTAAMAETASSKGQQVGATPAGWSHSTITGVEEIIAGDNVVSYRVEFSRHLADGTTRVIVQRSGLLPSCMTSGESSFGTARSMSRRRRSEPSGQFGHSWSSRRRTTASSSRSAQVSFIVSRAVLGAHRNPRRASPSRSSRAESWLVSSAITASMAAT